MSRGYGGYNLPDGCTSTDPEEALEGQADNCRSDYVDALLREYGQKRALVAAEAKEETKVMNKTKLSSRLIPLDQRTEDELTRKDDGSVWWLVILAIAALVAYTVLDRATAPRPDALPLEHMNSGGYEK